MKLTKAPPMFLFIALLLVLTFIFMMGLWVIDISASAMISGGAMVTLIGVCEPVVMYHFGLAMVTTSFFIMAVTVIYYATRLNEKNADK